MTFYTIKETAELFKVPETVVSQLVRSGKLDAGEINGEYRINEIDIEAFYKRSKKELAKKRKLKAIEKYNREQNKQNLP